VAGGWMDQGLGQWWMDGDGCCLCMKKTCRHTRGHTHTHVAGPAAAHQNRTLSHTHAGQVCILKRGVCVCIGE